MKRAGVFQVAAAMAIWSTWGLCVRWLPVPAWSITFFVGVAACGCAAALWILAGGKPSGLWPRRYIGPLTAMGLVFLVNNVCFLTAYERTSVANAVITHYTAPIFVALLAPLTLRERLLPSTPVALVLGCGGMALILPEASLTLADLHLQGLALGTLSGVAYAVLILMARHLSVRVPLLALIFYQNLVIAAVLLPFILGAGVQVGAPAGSALLLLGAVHATGGGLLYLTGIRALQAQVAAILGYLEPVFAVILGAAVLGEMPSWAVLAGGALVLTGGGLVVWDEGRRQKPVDA